MIPGYTYGTAAAAKSPITLDELELLKRSADFAADDARWLRRAGEILRDHTAEIVQAWRAVISANPHLARYSASNDPRYGEQSGARFQQWILDTCCRPYDQAWLDYQQEIALRHTTVKKNVTDGDDAHAVDRMHQAWCKSVLIQVALWAEPYSAEGGFQ